MVTVVHLNKVRTLCSALLCSALLCSANKAFAAPPVGPGGAVTISASVQGTETVDGVTGPCTNNNPLTNSAQTGFDEGTPQAGSVQITGSAQGKFVVDITNTSMVSIPSGQYFVDLKFTSYAFAGGINHTASLSGTTDYEKVTSSASTNTIYYSGSGDLYQPVPALAPGATVEYDFPFKANAVGAPTFDVNVSETISGTVIDRGAIIDGPEQTHYIDPSSDLYTPGTIYILQQIFDNVLEDAAPTPYNYYYPMYRSDVAYVQNGSNLYDATDSFYGDAFGLLDPITFSWSDTLNLLSDKSSQTTSLSQIIDQTSVAQLAKVGPKEDTVTFTATDSLSSVTAMVPVYLHAPVELTSDVWAPQYTGDLVVCPAFKKHFVNLYEPLAIYPITNPGPTDDTTAIVVTTTGTVTTGWMYDQSESASVDANIFHLAFGGTQQLSFSNSSGVTTTVSYPIDVPPGKTYTFYLDPCGRVSFPMFASYNSSGFAGQVFGLRSVGANTSGFPDGFTIREVMQ